MSIDEFIDQWAYYAAVRREMRKDLEELIAAEIRKASKARDQFKISVNKQQTKPNSPDGF